MVQPKNKRLVTENVLEDTVNDLVNTYVPGTEMGYAERLTNFTTTATSVATAVDITGLTVTVVGHGRPADIEFYAPSVSHSVSGTQVSLIFYVNGSYTSGQGQVTQVFSNSTTSGVLGYLKRRSVLSDGVTYNISVRPYAYQVAGTTTIGSLGGYQPIFLSVTAR